MNISDRQHIWDLDIQFNQIVSKIEYTPCDKLRCFIIYQIAQNAFLLNGDIAEIGVYRGGTARIIAEVFNQKEKCSEVCSTLLKKIHLFDTFSGMPPSDSEKDFHKEGDFSDTSLDLVKNSLIEFDNIHFYKGIFPETAEPIMDTSFCLVHIDVDIYKSVLDCCDFFYPRMVQGGIMIFDDYGFLSCPGAKEAVDTYFLDKPETPVYLPTGQAIVMRLFFENNI